MIEVELPDGRILEVDAADEATAASAAKAFLDREKGAAPAPAGQQTAGIAIPTPGAPAMPETTSALERFVTGGDNGRTGRSLQVGAQGAGRGAAELAGMPVDLATGALNALGWVANKLGIPVPTITRPVGGSQQISDLGGAAMEAMGVPPIAEESMSVPERLAYNVNRMGAQAVAGSGVGARVAAGRVAEGATAPRMSDALVRPYAENASRAATGDVAAGVGSGTAVTAAEELAPGNPLAATAASVLGGVGGATAAAPRTVPGQLANAVRGRMASDIPYDPQMPLAPTTNRVADKAATVLRDAATDPQAAGGTIAARRAEFEAAGLPEPTSGLLSQDPGLVGAEKVARTKNAPAFIARDQQLQDAASESVASARPRGTPEGDANRAAQGFAEREAGGLRQRAQQQRSTAEQNLAAANQRLQTLQAGEATASAPVAARRGDAQAAAASQQLDAAVTGDLQTRTTIKNEGFDSIDPDRTEMVPAATISATAARIREQANGLTGGRELPTALLRRLEALTPRPQRTNLLGPNGERLNHQVSQGGGEVSLGALVDVRKYLRGEIDRAHNSREWDLKDNLQTLRRQINEVIDAAPQSEAAQRYYREEYAPFFAQGPGKVFRDRVQRDSLGRTALPPSEVAKFWLGNTEENAAHLARILHASPNRAVAEQAVRNFMVSDMARAVDQTGRVNLPLVNRWISNNAGVLQHFPALRQEIEQFRGAVTRNQGDQTALRGTIENLANAVRAAERNIVGTERAINDGMLGVLINNSPENAARSVIGASDPVRAARDMNVLLNSAPPNIRQGVKDSWAAAVADHIAGKVRTTRETPNGNDVISYAQLVREMRRNQAVYAEIFRDQPGAMNALQRAQKALEPLTGLSTQATRGSPTAENIGAWDKLEVGLKAYYGVLKGGGILRTLRLYANKFLPNDEPFVGRLVERALLEPRVAEALFARDVRQAGTPGWNANLTKLLGVAEGARTGAERRDEKR